MIRRTPFKCDTKHTNTVTIKRLFVTDSFIKRCYRHTGQSLNQMPVFGYYMCIVNVVKYAMLGKVTKGY